MLPYAATWPNTLSKVAEANALLKIWREPCTGIACAVAFRFAPTRLRLEARARKRRNIGFPRNFLPVVVLEARMRGKRAPARENEMHKDEAKGSAKKMRGGIKDAVGKATGDEKLRAEGKADKGEGKLQKGVGKAKDAVRDALKR